MEKPQKGSKYYGKKILFFDGDGTLWYPKTTKHEIHPHWIYKRKNISGNYIQYLTIIPTVIKVLRKLKNQDIVLILLSTHPYAHKKAMRILKKKIDHFKLADFFDEYHATIDNPEAKGNMVVDILKHRGIAKSKALMIGDSYWYDYISARKVGIEALLLKTKYTNYPLKGRKTKNTIKSIKEIPDLILS